MDNDAEVIISEDIEKVDVALDHLIENNLDIFSFPELNQNNYRHDIWKALFSLLHKLEKPNLHIKCLSALRILSRDKADLGQIITEERMDVLLNFAGLKVQSNSNINIDFPVTVQALKCLCNFIFNCPIGAAIASKNGTVEGIIERLRLHRHLDIPADVKYFDMKILFLLTALCPEIRIKVKQDLHGLKYSIDALDYMVQDFSETDCSLDVDGECKTLSDAQVDLACEILKVLFNLTLSSDERNADEEEEAQYLHLVSTLHKLLIQPTHCAAKRFDLDNHVANLLTNMPNKCFKSLVQPLQNEQHTPKHLQYDGNNMKAINELFRFLEHKFINDVSISQQHEILSPLLTVLLKCAISDKVIRKYLRLNILPPLRDVHNRPEQGNTVRNHLCRLLTSPATHVRDLVADLLFMLCKENVGRMIKYTGYGNAAGLFANRGLLGGRTNRDASYSSSESEDSDTEEYREFKHGINPVIGCYEPPHQKPMADMTEEQREYEAMKLVELIDSLTRRGIVQPCKIGEDGRPEPIEHVLQLQEGLPNQQVHIHDTSDVN